MFQDIDLRNINIRITRMLSTASKETTDFINSHEQQAKFMMKICCNFKYAFSGPLGHHISGILHFMEFVNQIAALPIKNETLTNKDLITKWFRVGVIQCSTNDIFYSFFALNKIISIYGAQITIFDETKRHLWVSFSQEIVSFFSTYDADMIYILSHYKFDAKLKRRKSTH